MKKEENTVRRKMVVVRLNDKEYEIFQKFQRESTERKLSTYLRKLALHKPVTVKYRNATADDFLRDMVSLKKELSAIGNNYNQAVRKLHVLEKIPEFRGWILINQGLQQQLHAKVSEIYDKVTQLYEQWLQK